MGMQFNCMCIVTVWLAAPARSKASPLQAAPAPAVGIADSANKLPPLQNCHSLQRSDPSTHLPLWIGKNLSKPAHC